MPVILITGTSTGIGFATLITMKTRMTYIAIKIPSGVL